MDFWSVLKKLNNKEDRPVPNMLNQYKVITDSQHSDLM